MKPIRSSSDAGAALAATVSAAAGLRWGARAEPGIERLRARALSWRGLTAYALPALLYALWWAASHRQWMSPQILPTPEQVWETGGELLADNLVAQLLISLKRFALGVSTGVAAGALLGAWTGASRRADAIVSPSFHALAQIPPLVWLPLLMLVLGIGEALKVVLIFKAVLVPVTLHTQEGVRNVPPRLREMAATLRLSRGAVWTRLIAPAALPSFMTGLRFALAQGWLTLLAVELLASSEGIGYLMVWGRQMFELDVVLVCIVVIGLAGLAMDQGVQWIDAKLVRWPRPALAEHASGTPRAAAERAWGALLPALTIALWSVAAHEHWADARILPAPQAVLTTLAADVRSGALIAPLLHTLARAAQGLLLGAAVGLLLGVAVGLFGFARRSLAPTLAALRQVAIFAWIPLLTAWAGIDELSKVIFVALAAFFPVYVATYRALDNLSPQLDEAARTLRLDFAQRLRWLIAPAIAPGVFAGLRLALIYAWLGAIGAEYFMPSGAGIGRYMLDAQQLFRMDQLLAAAAIVGSLGAALGWLGARLEAAATRWRGPR